MAGTRRARLARALGAAAVALVLAAGPLAQNASAGLAGFSGDGTGFAARLIVDLRGLPDAVKDVIQTAYDPIASASDGALPQEFPFLIDQRIIETLVEMGGGTKAQAFLARGLIDFPESAEADTIGESDTAGESEKKIPDDSLPLLTASVAELLASVAAGPKVAGSGTLASVAATLEAVAALAPDLATALGDLSTTINGAVATAQGTLDGVLGDIADSLVEDAGVDTALEDLLGGLVPGIDVSDPVSAVPDLTTELTDTLQLGDALNLVTGTLASVDGLDNDAVAERTADKAMSDASSSIASVDVLGLLNASVIDLTSHSEAAGTAGSAKNTSDCTIAAVGVPGVGDGDLIALDGETLVVGGETIPVPTDLVDEVKGVVDSVLSAIGVVGDVGLCDTEPKADPDGTSASQRVSALHIELALEAPDAVGAAIGAGDELVRVVIDPSVETAVTAQVAAAQPQLPRTGAPLIATLLSGLALVGGALVLRRRLS